MEDSTYALARVTEKLTIIPLTISLNFYNSEVGLSWVTDSTRSNN